MNYWLFKTEPDEFGIDHLAASPNQTARWDGIRNYQARNYLRDMVKPGDKIFIYHGQCKKPGIYGIAQVKTAPYPDPAQFDPQSNYFDPKSLQTHPRWFCVDIQLHQKYHSPIPIQLIKAIKLLHNMILLKQGRLSVQPVTIAESIVLLDIAENGSTTS